MWLMQICGLEPANVGWGPPEVSREGTRCLSHEGGVRESDSEVSAAHFTLSRGDFSLLGRYVPT